MRGLAKAFNRGVTWRKTGLRAPAIALILGLPLFVLQSCGGETTSSQNSVYSLFTCSPCNPYPGDYGVAGCTTQTNPGTCNEDCQSYTAAIPGGIQMTAGPNCHTVNSHEQCTFSIGDGGVTRIEFDFTVTDACHQTVDTTEWLSFWIYSRPWNNTIEADFIESLYGPGGKNGGLNSNFAGNGNQVEFFKNGDSNWSGHITATFSGSGNRVAATITNSHDSRTASFTMTKSDGYFFVMDTALGSGGNTQCSFTVSNLKMQGTVPNGQCQGLIN